MFVAFQKIEDIHMWCSIGFSMSASTVKWTAIDPCPMLSESDLDLYITFDFLEGKKHRHLKKMLIYKVKHFMMTKTKF